MKHPQLLLREVISDTWSAPNGGRTTASVQKDRYERIRRLKTKYNPVEIFALGIQLMTRDEYRCVVDPTPFPKKYSDINIGKHLLYQAEGVLHEIAWLLASIRTHSEAINRFVILRDDITDCMLNSDYNRARELISKTEAEFGISRWLTQVKFFLLECTNEFSEQKRISTAILSDESISGELRCAVHFLSWKTEKNVSHQRYSALIEDNIAKHNLGDFASQYYGFICNFDVNSDYSELAKILSSENGSSVVDKYESLLKALCVFCKAGKSGRELASLSDLLGLVSGEVNDAVLLSVVSVLSGKVERSDRQALFLDALDAYTRGDYVGCLSMLEPLLRTNTNSIAPFVVAARSLIASGNQCVAMNGIGQKAALIDDLVAIISRRSGSSQTIADFKKRAVCSPSISWAIQVVSFLDCETTYLEKSERKKLAVQMLLVNGLKTPLGIARAEGVNSVLFSDLVAWRGESPALRVIGYAWNRGGSDRGILGDVPEYRVKKYEAMRYLNRGNFSEVERIISVTGNIEGVYRHELTRMRVDALLGNDRIEEAAELVVASSVLCPDLRDSLPIYKIWNAISRMRKAIRPCGIWYPILAVLCESIYGRKRYDTTAEALDDFLRHMRYESVADVYGNRESSCIDARVMAFFYKNVCTWRSLEYCVMRPSQVDVEQERIRVCMILCEVDSENAKVYKEEMLSIDNKINIMRGDQELNKSRIYVNTAGIRSVVLSMHADMMRRYVQYRGEIEDKEVMYIIPQRVIKGSASDIKISSNERITILEDLCLIIRDMFASSPAYGLDGYLSVRVRHGELANHVLSSFDEQQLVVKVDSNGQHVLGQRWIAAGINGDLEVLLRDLSRDLADIIEDIRASVIQIKTERTNSVGLFDYSLSPEIIRDLHKKFKDVVSTDVELVDAVLGALWERTNLIAETVRSELSIRLRDEILSKVSLVEERLVFLMSCSGAAELRAALSVAKSRFSEEAKLIIGWFNRYEPQTKIEWRIETIVGLAERGGRQHHPRKKLAINSILECRREFNSEFAVVLMTIVQILIENIYEHAIRDGGQNSASLLIRDFEDIITIECTSGLPADFDVAAGRRRVESLLCGITSEVYLTAATGEKSSGLYKIYKAIKYDIGCIDPEFSVLISPDREFVVSMKFRWGRGV